MAFRLRSVIVALALLVIWSRSANAAGPARYLSDKQAELGRLLNQKRSPANDRRIAAALDSLLDDEAVARAALGNYWRKRTVTQRNEFRRLYKELLRDFSCRHFSTPRKYSAQHSGVPSSNRVVVKSVASGNAIHYFMSKTRGSWRVEDVIVGGASLTGNHRVVFAKTIQKEGFDRLLRRMEAMAAKESRRSFRDRCAAY